MAQGDLPKWQMLQMQHSAGLYYSNYGCITGHVVAVVAFDGGGLPNTAPYCMPTRRLLNQRRILDGAAHILETGSWGGFTVDSLARYLKMSKSTLYRCFVSKEAVVNMLIGEICARVDGHYMRIAQEASSPAHIEFERFVDAYAAFCEELPRAVITERGVLPADTRARLMVTRIHLDNVCSRILRLGRAQGLLRVEDPTVVAAGFVAALEAVVEFTARRDGMRSPSEPVRAVAEVFLSGLLQLSSSPSRRSYGAR